MPLYDPDTSLSRRDGDEQPQSSSEAEAILARELGALRLAAPTQQLPNKQRLLHFIDNKVTHHKQREFIQLAAGRQAGRQQDNAVRS